MKMEIPSLDSRFFLSSINLNLPLKGFVKIDFNYILYFNSLIFHILHILISINIHKYFKNMKLLLFGAGTIQFTLPLSNRCTL